MTRRSDIKTSSREADETDDLFVNELARTVLNSLSTHIAILDETGTILKTKKVLLKQREEDKLALERKVLGNIKDLVLPYVE